MDNTPEGSQLAAVAGLGLRGRAKIRRRLRIKEAAREVFLERGYENATTREIAERAEVSFATLFAYARTKPELLLMIVNDDLDELTAKEFEDISGKSLIDVLLNFCTSRYAYWKSLGELARPARREITGLMVASQEPGPEGQRFRGRRPRILENLAEVVAEKQKEGTITSTASPELVSALFWSIYYSEVERWLGERKPNRNVGIARLHQMFAIAIQGLGVRQRELSSARGVPSDPNGPSPKKKRTSSPAKKGR